LPARRKDLDNISSELDNRIAARRDGSVWNLETPPVTAPARARRVLWGIDMEAPPGLKYSKEHEWVATEESVATIGITDHAQDQLGEIVYLELPSVGEKISKDDPFGVVESVKAVSDIYAPVSGTVVEVNEGLPESPEVINEDPYGDGWLIKVRISDATELDDLMDGDEYDEMVAKEKE
jgi:glycine cleavage system H protein